MRTPAELLLSRLANAPLSPEQHLALKEICSELVDARRENLALRRRVKELEEKTTDETSNSVLTRPEFNREVARMLAFEERYGGSSSVLYFDIENLQEIIEAQGREMAEEVIRCISDVLLHHIRRSDIMGRLALDELGILLPRCDNGFAWKKGEQLAGQVFEAIKDIPSLKITPSVSYGAYTFNEKEDVATGLKKAAQTVTQT